MFKEVKFFKKVLVEILLGVKSHNLLDLIDDEVIIIKNLIKNENENLLKIHSQLKKLFQKWKNFYESDIKIWEIEGMYLKTE
jgi:hypothetical protein